jgi:hypothetical protein
MYVCRGSTSSIQWAGGHNETPLLYPQHCYFLSNSRLKPRSPCTYKRGVSYETSPPCGDPPPPLFIFGRQGGFILPGPRGGLNATPLPHPGGQRFAWNFRRRGRFPVFSENRGGGFQLRSPTSGKMRPPPLHGTPPCPGFFFEGWGDYLEPPMGMLFINENIGACSHFSEILKVVVHSFQILTLLTQVQPS